MCSSGMCDFTILLQVLKVVLVILFFSSIIIQLLMCKLNLWSVYRISSGFFYCCCSDVSNFEKVRGGMAQQPQQQSGQTRLQTSNMYSALERN